jgi:Glycosyltransferase family 87
MTARTWVGGIALAALAVLGVTMAAAGPDVTPADGYEGAYGGGLGIDGDAYIHLERVALVAYAAVLACATALPRRLLWAATGLLLLAFAVAPPLLSLDLFSYVSYARLDALHGLNPYEAVPADAPGDAALPYVLDNRDVVSAYGPLFTLVTLPLAQLGVGAAVYSLKALAALSVVATALLAARLATARGLDPRAAVALIALNPLVLVHVVGGGHNDALMALVMTLGVAGALSARELSGGIGLVAAAGIKASAAVAIPFAAVAGYVEDNRRLLVGLIAGVGAVAGIALLAFGPAADAALDVADSNQQRGTSLSVPNAIADALGVGVGGVKDALRVAYLGAVLVLLVWVARGLDWVRAAGWAALGLLVASNYLTPWYVILPLPLAAIARDRALVAATVLLSAFMLREQVAGLGA